MAKLARLFLFLVFCMLVTVCVPLIYLMSQGSKETDVEMATWSGAAVRGGAGTPASKQPDAPSTPSHPPPFTASQTPPFTASQTPPSTTSQTPPSTTSQTPPSTTSQTPPSTTSQTPPSTTSQTPPSTTSQTPPSTTSETPPSATSQTLPSTTSETPPSTSSQTPPSTTSETPPSTVTPTAINPWKKLIAKSAPFTLITPIPDKHRPHPLPRPSNYKPEPHRRSKAGRTFNKDGSPYYPSVPAAKLADFDDVQFEDETDNGHVFTRDKVNGYITRDDHQTTDEVRLVLEAQRLYRRILEHYLERLKQRPH